MNLYNLTKGTYYLVGDTGVTRDQPSTLTLRPSVHPSGLLQWQAKEFDGQAASAVEAERPRPCARYPQDCAGEDWGPGEWESCPYMKSGGRTPCGWRSPSQSGMLPRCLLRCESWRTGHRKRGVCCFPSKPSQHRSGRAGPWISACSHAAMTLGS